MPSDGGSIPPTSTNHKGLDSLQALFLGKLFGGRKATGADKSRRLVHPKTDVFDEAPSVLDFPKPGDLRLWVLSFCLRTIVCCCRRVAIWIHRLRAVPRR